MNFTTNSENLKKSLTALLKVISSKTGLSSLEGVMMTLKDNTLTMRTTNLETTVITTLQTEGKEDGQAVIPAKLLMDLLKNMGTTGINFKNSPGNNGESNEVVVSWDTGKSRFPNMDNGDFPPAPDMTGTGTNISGKSLKEALGIVTDSLVFDELRPIFGSACFDFKNDRLVIVGTDSHELTAVSLTLETPPAEERQYIIPLQVLTTINTVLKDDGMTTVICSEKNVTFTFGNTSVTGILTEGRFPAYESILPKTFLSTLTVDKKEAITTVKRVSLASSESIPFVTLCTDNGKITIKGECPTRGTKTRDTITADEQEGENGEYNFLAPSLAKLLGKMPGEKIRLGFNGPARPVLITPTDSEKNIQALLMPCQIKNN